MHSPTPPLPWWAEAWRLGVVSVIGLGAYVLFLLIPPLAGEVAPWWMWLDPVLGVLALILVHWRRRWPALVAILTSLAGAVSVSAGIVSSLAVVSLGTRRRWREILIVAPFYLAAGQAFDFLDPISAGSAPLTSVILQSVAYVAMISLGAYIGARRDSANLLRQRVESAEKEVASRAIAARSDERARIAREMHDTLAHRISLIAVHAGALSYRDDLTREQVKETALLLRDNADEAVRELRDVLGVLRATGDPGQSRLPTMSLPDVPLLIDEMRDTGTDVSFSMAFDHPPETLTPSSGRHAYRIVQETLTNARKHAPGMPVNISLTGGRDYGLGFRITTDAAAYGDEAPAPESSGMGLLGLAERVELAGGTLVHGTDRAGRFVVHGRLPWEALTDEP